MPLMHKPNASTGKSSVASGGKSICATTIITANIARLKPKSELINPFQNIHQTFHQMYQVFYIFPHLFKGNIKTRRYMLYVCTGSYFRKHYKHLHMTGEGLVISLIWGGCGILATSSVKICSNLLKSWQCL